MFGPTYTFEQPVLGGQLALSLLSLLSWGGWSDADVAATLTGCGGQSITRNLVDSISGIGDLIPQATLKWTNGAHN